MAEFKVAYAITAAHEGGYVNDPVDRGGETYRGIARVHHPDWSGWRRVDAQRRKAGFPRTLGSDRALQDAVRRFYKKAYWDRFDGDHIREVRYQDTAHYRIYRQFFTEQAALFDAGGSGGE